jgi:hypothetical protein
MRLAALRRGGGLFCQSTPQCAPHIHGLRSPPDMTITSAAVITTRSNRALSRLKSTPETKNNASTRIRANLVIVVINSSPKEQGEWRESESFASYKDGWKSPPVHLCTDSYCFFLTSRFSMCLVRTLLEEKFTPFFIRSKSTPSPSELMAVTLVRSISSFRVPKSWLAFLQVAPSSATQAPVRVPSTSRVRRDGVSAMDILNMLPFCFTLDRQDVCQNPRS